MNKIQKQTIVGRGIVGTWLNKTLPLGGMLPAYLSSKQESVKECRRVASQTKRFQKFRGDGELWYCEITIKPIKQIKEIPYVEDKFL